MGRLRTAVRQTKHRLTAPLALSRLERSSAPGAAIATALRRSRGDEFAADERAWLDRLDDLRKQLAASDEVLATAPSTWTGVVEGDDAPVSFRVSDLLADVTKPREWTSFLFALLRETRPATGVELGACLGVSAAHQGAALELNGSGRLVTVELAPERAAHAERLVTGLGLETVAVRRGHFDDVLPSVLDDLGAVDYAFVDGHHEEHAVGRYVDLLRPALAPGAIVVVDDIRWSPGMLTAWRRIEASDAFSLTVDLGEIGLAVAGAGPGTSVRVP